MITLYNCTQLHYAADIQPLYILQVRGMLSALGLTIVVKQIPTALGVTGTAALGTPLEVCILIYTYVPIYIYVPI